MPLKSLGIRALTLSLGAAESGIVGTIRIALPPSLPLPLPLPLPGVLGGLIPRAPCPAAAPTPALGPGEVRPQHGSRQSQTQSGKQHFINLHYFFEPP